jgi:hypothetical protein
METFPSESRHKQAFHDLLAFDTISKTVVRTTVSQVFPKMTQANAQVLTSIKDAMKLRNASKAGMYWSCV